MKFFRKKKNNGFTLIEILLVIGVILGLSIIKVKDINAENENAQAKLLANQISTVSDSANAFLVMKYNELSSLSSSPGVVCNTSKLTCDLSLSALQDLGLLPPNFSNKTIFGQDYEIQVKRTGVAPNYMLSGLVLTKGVKLGEVKSSPILVGKTVNFIGGDGGWNKEAGKISGNKGGWSADSMVYPILSGKKDYIGSSVGVLSGAYYVYLRRDGVLPMMGDLDMNEYNIKNVKDLNVKNNVSIGKDLNVSGNINGEKDIAAGRNINATGNISANENVSSGKDVMAGNWLVAHNGNGNYIKMGGDSNGDFDFVLDASAPSKIIGFFPSDSTAKFMFNFRGDIVASSPKGVGAISLDGTSGDITASGNIQSNKDIKGQTIQLTKIVSAGTSCPVNGSMARDNTGQILNCISGFWKPDMPVGIPQPWPSTTPPDGWLVCNGQPFDVNRYPLLAKAYPSGVLPDLRGNVIRGLDQGRGLDTESSRVVLSQQMDTIQNHNHALPTTTGFVAGSNQGDKSLTSLFIDYNKNVFIMKGDENEGTLINGNNKWISSGAELRTYDLNYSAKTDWNGADPRYSIETRVKNLAFVYIVRAM